ncbi:alcohol oxidase [Lyophyllum atratum]|nr:alcohol oxidase [Lyophyllum atratum]
MLSADYVVVGAGLTGTALAVRLSEDPTVTVTVLEAGGDKFHDENLDTPAYIVNNLGNPDKDWAFFSSPQKHLGGRSMYLPRGKGVGGSSLLNFMEVNRASSTEYDAFGKLGSSRWGWTDLLPYFQKSETLVYNEEAAAKYGLKFDQKYQGASGPIQRTVPHWLDPIAMPWLEAVKFRGIQYNPDPNDGDDTGLWISTKTIDRNSIRSSAASAYYEPNKSRANLQIITGAHAARILTSAKDLVVATGVEFLKDGILQTIQAKKEVIICCGSYQTPQILELSGKQALGLASNTTHELSLGIGDPKVLNKHGIPVVVDLPGVGNNLQMLTQEHVTATYTAKLIPGHETWENMRDPSFAKKQEEIYRTSRGGMLSALPSAFAFLPFKDFDTDGEIANSVKDLKLPDTPSFSIQKEWVKNDSVPFLEINAFDRFMPGTVAEPAPDVNYMSSSAILLHPFSRGSVHITSNDPTAAPEIDINVLDNETDLKILVKGYRMLREIYSTDPLKDHIDSEVSPGKNIQTDEELIEYIRKTVGSTYHPVATASMLPREAGGCVDAELKVYGTENLRVVDASILPIQIATHPQATLYAIAEKMADVIKSNIQI